MYFTITEPPRHFPQHLLLINESIHITLMVLCCIMMLQKDELVLWPVKKYVVGLQLAVGRYCWFLAWPRVSWTICLYVALLAGMRAEDKYLLGGEWCEWLVSFWRSFAFSAVCICFAELLLGIYNLLAKVCRRGRALAKADKKD
mmetsp:Transcript_38119/g.52243  ORF Transcript_38119/g.52243 Transcript_38119/m.52243 type:complete len:144 (+) Transcript_38119:44-475(+)